ncbi:hypothetical protein [Caulobacter sp. D5]|uniref:hypothetical protein n=1 Tax=Caulobacter sp. D5 TaxID=357400 RepID=UPI0011B59259|nr:hypothetical protein [Caulobacter sp. D5]
MTDFVTLALRFLFRVAGASNPIRFLFGIAFGIITDVLIGVIYVANPNSSIFRYLNELPLAIHILVVVPMVLIVPLLGKRGAPEGIAADINTIQALMDRADLPKYRQRQVWEGIIVRVAEKVSVPGRKEDVTTIATNEIATEVEPTEPT